MAGSVTVASLIVALTAKTDQLEKDLAKGRAQFAQYAAGAKEAGDRGSKALDSINVGAIKLAAGMHLVSGALKEMGGEGEKQTAKILDGVAKVAAAYALGGPFGAGVVAITELIAGLSESARQDAARRQKHFDDAVASAGSLRAEYLKVGLAAEASGRTQEQAAKKTIDALKEKLRLVDGDELASKEGIDAAVGRRRAKVIGLQMVGTPEARQRIGELEDDLKRLQTLQKLAADVASAQTDLMTEQKDVDRAGWDPLGLIGVRTRALEQAQRAFNAATATHGVATKEAVDAITRSMSVELDKLKTIQGERDFAMQQIVSDGERRKAVLRASLSDLPTDTMGQEQVIASLIERQVHLKQLGTEASKEELAQVSTKVEVEKDYLEVLKQVAPLRADKDLARQIDALRAVTRSQQDTLAISNAVREWTKRGASQGMVDGLVAAMRQKPWLEFARDMSQDFGSLLSDEVYDGLVDGGKKGSEILVDYLHSAIKRTLDSVFTTSVDSLLSMLLGGGRGSGGGAVSSLVSLVTGGSGGGAAAAAAAGEADCPT